MGLRDRCSPSDVVPAPSRGYALDMLFVSKNTLNSALERILILIFV